MGVALHLVGPQSTGPDPATVQPVLKLRLSGGKVDILWGWEGARAVTKALYIEVDRGAGPGFLAADPNPNYTDSFPPPRHLEKMALPRHLPARRRNDRPVERMGGDRDFTAQVASAHAGGGPWRPEDCYYCAYFWRSMAMTSSMISASSRRLASRLEAARLWRR